MDLLSSPMAQYEKQTTNGKWDIDNTNEVYDSRIRRYCSRPRFGSNAFFSFRFMLGQWGMMRILKV